MRDKPMYKSKLDWPGGVVPEWARPQGNPNKRRRSAKGGNGPGGGGGGGKRERVQKVMAQSGYGSRRNIEILIAQGHVTVNGQPAKLGDSVGPGDKVKLDGKLVRLRFGEPLPRVLLYHKPEGEIVTRDDPEGRATVFEKLPKVQGGRWVSVGRLDLNTGGLLIFTTSGELANRLTHPRFEVEREYAVRILGELDEEKKAKLLAGVDIDGESCKFDSIEDRGGEGSNHWYHVVLREGKNREVRKMCEAVGLTVSRLMRVRFGEVALPSFLKRGMMREMGEEEIQSLLAFSGMNEPEAGEGGEKEEHEEDEHDNIGNRAPEPSRKQRQASELDETRDNIGNRFDPRFHAKDEPHIDDDIGNRVDSPPRHGHAPPQGHGHGKQRFAPRGEVDGNRFSGHRDGGRTADGNRAADANRVVDGNRGGGDGQRTDAGRGHGHKHGQQPRPHGAKPFFKKKRGGGQGQGQGQGQAHGQPHGGGQHQQHRKHGPKGQGNPAAAGGAAPAEGAAPAIPGAQPPNTAPAGKRHRRNKHRHRNRGAENREGQPQPQNDTTHEPV